jgi:hypothetical protein
MAEDWESGRVQALPFLVLCRIRAIITGFGEKAWEGFNRDIVHIL